MTHNKSLIPLSSLCINCISAISTAQILSLKQEYTFLSSNFLIIAQCSSAANCCKATSTPRPPTGCSFWLKSPLAPKLFTSVRTPLAQSFLSKTISTMKEDLFDIIFWFYSRILRIAESLKLTLYSMHLQNLT